MARIHPFVGHANSVGNGSARIGTQNTAVGYQALTNNTTGATAADQGRSNSALGHSALTANTTGSFNVATGTNNIDMAAAEARGIRVMNVNAYGTHSVAQHTWMLLLALAGRLPEYQTDIAAGEWQRSATFCLLTSSETSTSRSARSMEANTDCRL